MLAICVSVPRFLSLLWLLSISTQASMLWCPVQGSGPCVAAGTATGAPLIKAPGSRAAGWQPLEPKVFPDGDSLFSGWQPLAGSRSTVKDGAPTVRVAVGSSGKSFLRTRHAAASHPSEAQHANSSGSGRVGSSNATVHAMVAVMPQAVGKAAVQLAQAPAKAGSPASDGEEAAVPGEPAAAVLAVFGGLGHGGRIAALSSPLLLPMVAVPPPQQLVPSWAWGPSHLGSLAAASGGAGGQTASSRAAAAAAAAAVAAPRLALAGFLVLFLFAAANFIQRGASFVHFGDRQPSADTGSSTGSSAFGPNKYRGWRFHAPVVAAVLIEATAFALDLFEVPGYVSLSWLSGARIAATVLLLAAIVAAGGAAKEADTCRNMEHGKVDSAAWVGAYTSSALLLGAWAQLAVAQSAVQPALRWGLFLSGITSIFVALSSAAAIVEMHPTKGGTGHSDERQEDKLESADGPLSMLWFCCFIYAFLWLPMAGFTSLGPTSRTLLMGLLDSLTVVGVGHLLLKRTPLLDRAMLPKTSGGDLRGDERL